jgi:hemerythrin-like metal-binding protein
VGISVIDEQHKQWLQTLNNFHAALQKGAAQMFVSDTLQALFDYTQYHFSEEENLFRQYSYPQAKSHMAEHKEFIEKLNLLQEDFKKSNLLLSLKTMEALKDWLINHILGTDKEYSEYFKSINS